MKTVVHLFARWLGMPLLICLVVMPLLGLRAAPPLNDSFANRSALTGTEILVEGTLKDATIEPEEPGGLHQTVWWSWTSPLNGRAQIVIQGDYTTMVLVWSGNELAGLQWVTNSSSGDSSVKSVTFPVTVGVAYQIAVGNPSGWRFSDPFTLGLVASTPLPNDDFARRIDLGTGDVRVAASNRVSSVEPGEPFSPLPDSPSGATTWWSWTALSSGPVAVTVQQQQEFMEPFYPLVVFSVPVFWIEILSGEVGVFQGSELTNLTRVPATVQLQRFSPTLTQVAFEAVAGATYVLRTHGWFGFGGRFTLNVAQTQPPSVILTSPTNRQSFIAGDPIRLAAQAVDPDGAVVQMDFHLTNTDDHFGIGLDEIGGPSVATMVRPFALLTNPPPGSYGLTAVATDNQGAKGSSSMISFRVRPANDDFARRIAVVGSSLTVTSSSYYATREAGEPIASDATVWWSWNAPSDGPHTITAHGGAQFVGVFTGNELTNLTLIAEGRSQRQDDHDSAQAVFTAIAGTSYAIALSGGNQLTFTPGSPPSVWMLNPTDDAALFLGDVLTLRAAASDVEGSVRQVDFYIDGELVGGVTNPPFEISVTLTNTYAYEVWAAATDNQGVRSYSEEVRFFVTHPPPENDLFANRTPLTGSSLTVTSIIAGASRELDEPTLGGGSVWWTWSAPISGTYTITAVSEGYEPFLGIYKGAIVSNLTTIASDWYNGPGNTPGARAVIEATAGEAYVIAVTGGTEDHFTLNIVSSEPPSVRLVSPLDNAKFILGNEIAVSADASDPERNLVRVDFFADYNWIGSATASPYSVIYTPTNVYQPSQVWAVATDHQGLTTWSDEVWFEVRPAPPLNDSFAARIPLAGVSLTVTSLLVGVTHEAGEPGQSGCAWWSWTAPTSGVYTIKVSMPGYSPFLGVYSGSELTSLTPVVRHPNNGSDHDYSVRLSFDAAGGVAYAIAAGAGGESILSIHPTRPPQVSIVSPTNHATFEQGDTITLAANANDDSGISRVDFYFDSNRIGTFTNEPFVLRYTPDHGDVGHWLRAEATDNAGITTLSAEVQFTVLSRPIANDDFVQRRVLTGAIVSVVEELGRTTREPGEPWIASPDNGSMWWTWTAPMSGVTLLRAIPKWAIGSVEIYTGDSLGGLVFVAGSGTEGSFNQVSFNGVAGTPYQIRFVSQSRSGTVQLAILLDGVGATELDVAPEGRFVGRHRASFDRIWRVETSPDLRSWTPLTTNVSANGWLEWSDPATQEFPQRFYRVVPD